MTDTGVHLMSDDAVHLWAVQEPSKFTGSEVRDRHPDAPPLALAVAFKGASWTDPDSIPLMVMQTMLGRPVKSLGGIIRHQAHFTFSQ